ncbi:D-alanyl-D-alanine carboxypeptidase [Streptomyces hypolithicus]
MNRLHTPKASRNQETGRLSFMGPVSPPPAGPRRPGAGLLRGAPSGGGPLPEGRLRAAPSGCAPLFTPCTFLIVSAAKRTAAEKTAVNETAVNETVVKRTAVRKTALTVLSAVLLPALIALPAHAATGAAAPEDKAGAKQPQPPAQMSTVGGTQLGRPGTQVKLGKGAPVLPKRLSGRSWIVTDAESGDVLAAHNAHWRLPPASTLKMLFADTVLPKLDKSQVHKVAEEELARVGAGSSLVGIKEDHTYSVHDLWLGVFLRSGNDAVHVLSEMNGGLTKTVKDMQTHAEELQALDTHVVSPDGYDAKHQVSSAYDLTLIARSGMQKKEFREYAATAYAKFPGGEDGKKRESFEIQNTNRLLTGAWGVEPYKGIAGIKNGSTTHAGSTFTGVAQRGERVLLVTVMNPSADEGHAVYKEAARLLDWGFEASGKVTPIGVLVPPKSAKTGKGAPPSHDIEAPGAGEGAAAKKQPTALASADDGSSGAGVALAVAGGALVVLAGSAVLVNRRWPLPSLGRRRPRR